MRVERYELMVFIDMHGMTFRYANNPLKNSEPPKRLSENPTDSAVMVRWAVEKNKKIKTQLWSSQRNYPTPRVF